MAMEDVLEWSARRRVAGLLTTESSGVVRTLALAQGSVAWASSSRVEEQIGQVLLTCGRVGEETLADALTVRHETQVPMGKILLMVGALEEEALVAVLATKIREAVSELVTWRTGTFDFEPRELPAPGVEAGIAIEAALGLARRRVGRWAQIRETVRSDDARFFARAKEMPAPPEAGPRTIDPERLWELALAGHSAAWLSAAFGGERFLVQDQLAQWMADGALGLERRAAPRTGSATELAAGARARLRQGDRTGALAMAQRALDAAPADPEVRRAAAEAERARVAEVARTLLARHRVPRLKRSPSEIAALELSEVERRLVHRIDGRWDLLSLVRTASVREAEVLLALARLAERGVVELS